MYPYKRETEANLTHTCEREVENGGRQPQVKECSWPSDAGRSKKGESPQEPPEGVWPCRHCEFNPAILISDFWPTEL